MAEGYLFLVSMPGLRRRDLAFMPRLRAIAEAGASAELIPTFPCVTSPVQMSMQSGKEPREHGIIGNGFFHRERGEVEMWVGRNGLVECDQIWDRLAAAGVTQAAWLAQNIKDAAADFIVTPEPIHHPDGRTELWCYSKPDGLYAKLLNDLGHFPLMNFWGPMSNVKSTEWIVNAALWLFQRERPRFNYVYVPHLDYAAQKFGPNSPQQGDACREADDQLGRLFDGVAALGVSDAGFLVVSEYGLTDVNSVIYPNRVLRDAGLARIDVRDGAEYLNVRESAAFAVVDHQFAHVYVADPSDVDGVAGIFEGMDGIAAVLRPNAPLDERNAGGQKTSKGSSHSTGRAAASLSGLIDHPRSGEVVLVCRPETWLAYYWWHDDAKAPPFARTVDIHNKPGYDPVELFIDMATRSIPLNASLVKGSHGAPAEGMEQHGLCVANKEILQPEGETMRDIDIHRVILTRFGL